jgi:hypothetical protein
MRAIQNYLPHPHHSETMRIFVQAQPQDAWDLARHYDMSSVPWVHFLFNLRTIADIFHHDKPAYRDSRIGLDQIAANGKGFMIIHEEPGKEVVVGAVGKFWHVDISFKEMQPEAFRDFDEPGWGKLAWAITVEPHLTGSTICFELRTTATDHDSWKKLNIYYHIIGSFSKLIRHSLMSHLEKELGALVFADDSTKYLPGDEIIPDAKYSITHHTNIEAPASIVWQYLMQLGCDRAGWYSIDLLDNAGVRGSDHQMSKWSDRKVGDRLAATPRQDSFFEVYKIEYEKFFVIGGETKTPEQFFKSTWSFTLEPIGEDATHLIVRAKMMTSPEWKEWFLGKIIYPPVHSIMEAVQLKTIKRYAERDAQSRHGRTSPKEMAAIF